MALTINPVGTDFVAEVIGADLHAPMPAAEFEAIRDAFHRFAVLVLRDQDIDDEQQIAFSERFGALETSLAYDQRGGRTRPEISNLSNVDEKGEIFPVDSHQQKFPLGNRFWHTDSSFKPVPAYASLLSGRTVPPEGGETEFADMRAAFDALTAERQREIDGLVAIHSIVESRKRLIGDVFDEDEKAKLPAVRQALVRVHPATGRKAIYAGSHATWIEGWPDEKGFALLRELTDFGTERRFVYTHRWQPKDLVMWDNRMVLHRGLPYESGRYRRVMRRTTVAGDGPTVAGTAGVGTVGAGTAGANASGSVSAA